MELNKVDPTSEIFLKSEGRAGGPTDPIQDFETVFNSLYLNDEDRKNNDFKVHPLYDLLAKFSHNYTPAGPDKLRKSFADVTKEVN